MDSLLEESALFMNFLTENVTCAIHVWTFDGIYDRRFRDVLLFEHSGKLKLPYLQSPCMQPPQSSLHFLFVVLFLVEGYSMKTRGC